MQASCNNIGARLAEVAFVSIGWGNAMGDFGSNRISREEPEKGKRYCCDIRAVSFSVYGDTLLFGLS
jgi:hypothetical protein